MNDELITVSPASDGDYEFAYHVKKSTEGELIRKTFGWNEAFERDFHKKEWRKRRPNIIKLDGVAIGTMAILEGQGYIEVGRFFILPEYQNRGIGTCLLHRVLRKADKDRAMVRLIFLNGNPAEALYKRNGFQFVKQTEAFRHMERKPQTMTQEPDAGDAGKPRR